ncbi:MAG TPA: molybdenum cofactor biosynthesis protein [Clostridium sp.]|nr:molybdenum cofactor biosynthesis protein [Clostridium sp.]
MGIIKGICISEKRGTKKREIEEANFIENWGIEEDAHAGNWHRQVSLLSFDKIEAFREKGANVSLGDFGENLIVEGFDFRSLPVGTRLHCGEVVLEMTQIGKECHSHCQIYKTMGDCIMPREGVFAKVLYGGKMKLEDEMTMELPSVDAKLTVAVITLSDKGFKGEREDESGPAIVTILKEAGYEIVETVILPDEQKEIERNLIRLADQRQVNLILTTGGTGFSIRDCTPEATMAVATRNAPGIAEAIRYGSMNITKRAMLGRGASVIRNETIIVNLPGSKKAVIESLGFIIDELEHGIRILKGSSSDCARK